MLGAVGLALGTLLNEYRAGQSLRLILEGTLPSQAPAHTIAAMRQAAKTGRSPLVE